VAAIYATALVEIKPGKKEQKKNLIFGYTRKMVFF
jgi:hypothetical protein